MSEHQTAYCALKSTILYYVQWNPINTATNGPKNIGCINRVALLTRVFFYKKMYGSFCQAAKKSGHNNTVAVRQGSTVTWLSNTIKFIYFCIIKDTVYFTYFSKQAKIMVNKNYLQVLVPCQTRQYRQHPYQQAPWLLLPGDAHLSETVIRKISKKVQ